MPRRLALLAALPLAHAAGQTCNRPGGPDLIIAEITLPGNYPAANGRDAFSLGTLQTNVGDAWINYLANTPAHPVMGQNLFRFSAGGGAERFEQIGQSWLIHGFCALSQNTPCQTCQPTDCTHLGIGCSTPDSAIISGTQSAMGPRWQVNPHTGIFTYPPASPPFAGPIPRRLQATLDDLLASAQYYVEATAVSPDDAAAGHQNNNASYRPAQISGGSGLNSDLILIGATTPEQPAIAAWRLRDPEVMESRIQVPGDGLLILCSRVYPMGESALYEYALYNMNCDAGVGAFSIPLDEAAPLIGPGFHDVDYTDGDGLSSITRDGTDWAAVHAPGAATWSTIPFAANPNGNGLLWGTLYNFRFLTSTGGMPGLATITLWKTPGITIQVPAWVPFPTPCYANCDSSTTPPILNVADFACFLNAFASNNPYANCDNSSTAPALNILDFACFLNAFAAGCS